MTFTVRLLSPDISQEITACNHVMFPAVNGDISILTGHSRLVTILKIGVFLEKTEKGWAPTIILGGFAEMHNDVLIVLVLDIEKISQDLTLEDANKGVEEASKELEKLKGELMELNTPLENDPNIIEAKTSLDLASARLQACQYINGIRSKY